MNLWDCDHPSCKRSVVGCGGAIGLRAIGWYFKRGESVPPHIGPDGQLHGGILRGPTILCPEHRPDPIPHTGHLAEGEEPGQPCAMCAADHEAERLQAIIKSADGEGAQA